MSNKAGKRLVPALRFPEFREKGEWAQKFGDEVFDQINNKKHDSSLPVLAITQEFGAIPRVKIDYQVSVTDKSIESYKVVESGDFIISLRSFQGGIEYSTYRGICSPAYVILRKKANVTECFFKHFFKTERFIQQLNRNIEGLRDGKMVSFKQFSELRLPIPLKDEQKEVANCLSTIDDLIAAQAKKIEALKAHKKGLMQQLFPAEGETVPRFRFPEFRDGPEWISAKLGDVSTIKSGGTPSRTNPDYWGGAIPWVTTSLIDSNIIFNVDQHITKLGLEGSSAKIFPKGTILMAMYGQGKTRGKVAVLGIDAATNQACAAILMKKKIEASFVFQNLASRYEEIRRISNPGGQENLSSGLIEGIPIICPESQKEQKRISSCLSSLDDLIAAQAQKLEALKTQKQGLMQGLFPSENETVV